MEVDFTTDPTGTIIMEMDSLEIENEIDFNISGTALYDSTGEVLFYSNGTEVRNKDHVIMQNGEYLGGGVFSSGGDGSPLVQGVLALPRPGNHPYEYYLFHEAITTNTNPGWSGVKELLWSTILMNTNGWKGSVIQKNIPVIEDTLDYGQITACKHANGQDWWVLIPDNGKGYYRILVTKDSISAPQYQVVSPYHAYDALCQVVFTPDGSRYIRYNAKQPPDTICEFFIYDFDRCTGLFSNERKYHLSVEFGYGGGVAVSPNSRVLYVATAKRIDQFDLEAPDIGASRITVAEFDSTAENCGGYGKYYFFLGQLAPDGKIYFSVPYTQGDKLHVINYPDSIGLSCNAEVHAFAIFPTFYLPNHPNYYLGALPNPCPTVGVSEPLDAGIKVYPNPAGSVVNVEIEEKGMFVIRDLQGREILRQALTAGKTAISVGNLPEGVYIWEIFTDNQQYYGKLMVE